MTLRNGDVGNNVKILQSKLHELNFLNDKIDGIFGTKTEEAVKAFQESKQLVVDGIVGPKTIKALDIKLVESNIKTMDWWKSDIQKIFAKGTIAQITDVDTKLTWKEKRYGGSNHADCQPCTAEDTAKLKKAYNNKWQWTRRAIIVTINGEHYAASMNGMPHGGQTIKNNNFPGHHCIHFTNSRTHGSNKVDKNHQKAIKKAALAEI